MSLLGLFVAASGGVKVDIKDFTLKDLQVNFVLK